MQKIEEFWYCVAPQEELPLYKGGKINSNACTNLIKFIELYKSKKHEKTPEETIKNLLLNNPNIIRNIRVLVGISDKRLYLDLSYLANIYTDTDNRRFVPEERSHLLKHNTTFFVRLLSRSPMKELFATELTKYFISHGLVDILNTFTALDKDQIIPIFNNLIAPKELQQKQAKYRGHGAEQAFAQIVTACGCSITPNNKHIDPMAEHDPNVDLSTMKVVRRDTNNENCHSFDLVVNGENGNIRVLIQSLIHSSDPGQYGVNKSDETIDIHNRIAKYNTTVPADEKVYLLGSVDGVGFCENPNGTITKMINYFDDFFQMHTLFKIPIFLQKIGMIDSIAGIAFDTNYFEKNAIEHFISTYLKPAKISDMTEVDLSRYKTLTAGKAVVVFK